MADNTKQFARIIGKILKTDRWVLIVCTGEMGEGKSCFTSLLGEDVSQETHTPFSYADNMTFSRKELKQWIDGDKEGKHQKKEYSVILADELISMFFKRNWYDADQIDGIELMNKCRDRHLCVMGNVPNFWDLDSALYSIITFWVHIKERGVAWVFQKDANPFATDKWHRNDNEKKFRKKGHPYLCKNFLCEIEYSDWSPEKKEEYYAVRNTKRVNTEGQRRKEERYGDVKKVRDELIRFAFTQNEKMTNKDLHDVIPDLSTEAIRLIRKRER